jgi:hypothetical protein
MPPLIRLLVVLAEEVLEDEERPTDMVRIGPVHTLRMEHELGPPLPGVLVLQLLRGDGREALVLPQFIHDLDR